MSVNIYQQIFKKHGLSATQLQILNIVRQKKIVLEIGPATGYMTRAFLKNNCTVDVVEKEEISLSKLPKKVRTVLNYSIEDPKIGKLLARDYDFIILADVLEHLVEPKKALKILFDVANSNTRLLISIPNIASWPMRKQLFFKGDFEYQDSGLLDKTHLHFYTVNSLPKLLLQNGWNVEEMIGTITRLPFEGSISKTPFFGWIYNKLIRNYLVKGFKNLSYYHFIIKASK